MTDTIYKESGNVTPSVPLAVYAPCLALAASIQSPQKTSGTGDVLSLYRLI